MSKHTKVFPNSSGYLSDLLAKTPIFSIIFISTLFYQNISILNYTKRLNMKRFNLIAIAALAVIAVACNGNNKKTTSMEAPKPGQCRNMLLEAGYTQQQIDEKLNSAFYNLFEGENKIYFEVGDSMAYISDIKNHDVRTEGMSYGMMISVQLDKQDMFNRLWRWSKKYMQHQDGPREGYFAWSCKITGEQNSVGTASDGELYFVTSLIFASNRWGNNGEINYLAEAQRILNSMFDKKGYIDMSQFVNRPEFKPGQKLPEPEIMNIINTKEKLITFVPEGFGCSFTDPSYHLPVFYEIWAKYANDGRADFWNECAQKSRKYLHKACHSITGLNSDYTAYDGSVMQPMRGDWGAKFRFDSWRVPMNIALDFTWSGADGEWQSEYGERLQSFFRSQGVDKFVDQYNLDGTPVDNVAEAGGYKALRHSLGLVATVAALSLTQPIDKSRDFIEEFWESKHEPYSDGYFDAYYDGLLNLFALMHLSGRYTPIEADSK